MQLLIIKNLRRCTGGDVKLMNGYDDSKEKGYWTVFRKCYWTFAIIFSVLSLSYVGFYAANVKECICRVPIKCTTSDCPMGDYFVYTTDSCPVACAGLGGSVANITMQGNVSLEDATLVS